MLDFCFSQIHDFEEMWSGLKHTDGISSPAVQSVCLKDLSIEVAWKGCPSVASSSSSFDLVLLERTFVTRRQQWCALTGQHFWLASNAASSALHTCVAIIHLLNMPLLSVACVRMMSEGCFGTLSCLLSPHLVTQTSKTPLPQESLGWDKRVFLFCQGEKRWN